MPRLGQDAGGESVSLPSSDALPEPLLESVFRATRPQLNRRAVETALQSIEAHSKTRAPVSSNVRRARTLNQSGLNALAARDASRAVSFLESARQANPADAEVASNLGYALLQAGDVARATVVLTEAIALAPRFAASWLSLGRCLARLGRHDDSVSAFWVARVCSKEPSVLQSSLQRWVTDPGVPAPERRAMQEVLVAVP
jgi:tetratricopeptide (TPR) repeat protein